MARRPLPLSCYCAHHSQLSQALSHIKWGSLHSCVMQRDFSCPLMHFMLPNFFSILLKNHFYAFYDLLALFLRFYYRQFMNSSNQTGVSHLKWYPMFVRINHEHRDYVYKVKWSYLNLGQYLSKWQDWGDKVTYSKTHRLELLTSSMQCININHPAIKLC
jgi:hypothetical protein